MSESGYAMTGPFVCPTCGGRGGACGTCQGTGQTWTHLAVPMTAPVPAGPTDAQASWRGTTLESCVRDVARGRIAAHSQVTPKMVAEYKLREVADELGRHQGLRGPMDDQRPDVWQNRCECGWDDGDERPSWRERYRLHVATAILALPTVRDALAAQEQLARAQRKILALKMEIVELGGPDDVDRIAARLDDLHVRQSDKALRESIIPGWERDQ